VLLLLALLAGCNLSKIKTPVDIPNSLLQQESAQPLSQVGLTKFGNETVGPYIELVNPPSWLKLLDANDNPVNRCAAYKGCKLEIARTAPKGNHNISAKLAFTGVSATVNIPIKITPKVLIEPAQAQVPVGGSIQFTAEVLGDPGQALTWHASCGEVSANGLFTAPDSPANCVVTAIAAGDPQLKAQASISVKPHNRLLINVTPDQASVTVSGPNDFSQSFKGDRVLESLDAGPYTVSASLAGYLPQSRTVQLTEDGDASVNIVLKEKPGFDLLPKAILTNEGTSSTTHETTVPAGTSITVYWGMEVTPESALAKARSKVSSPGVVVLLMWKPASASEFQQLARIYQMPGDDHRVYPLPAAQQGDNVLRVIVDPENKVLENDDHNNSDDWIIHGSDAPHENQPPTVSLMVASPSGDVHEGDAVSFIATATDSDGQVVSYQWDFDGDGNYDLTTTTNTASHSYASAGRYRAAVRVKDNEGAYGNASVTVEVLGDNSSDGVPPTISWSAPHDGDTITGPVVLKVDAQGDAPTVSYYKVVDNQDLALAENLHYPYEYQWNPTAQDNGSVVLKATATDPDGSSSASITVSVDIVDRMLWERDLNSYGTPQAGLVLYSPAAGAAQLAYTVSNYGKVISIDKQGNDWASDDVGEALLSPPTIAPNGSAIFVHSQSGKLYKINRDTSAVEWSKDLGSNYSSPRLAAPPAQTTSTVWVSGSDDSNNSQSPNNCVIAVDPSDGTIKHTTCFDHYVESVIAIPGSANKVLISEEASLNKVRLHTLDDSWNLVDGELVSAQLDNGVDPYIDPENSDYYLPSQTREILYSSLNDLSAAPSSWSNGVNYHTNLVRINDVNDIRGFAVNDGGDVCIFYEYQTEPEWCYSANMSTKVMPVYNAAEQEIYAVSVNGTIYALKLADGSLRFSYQLPGSGSVVVTPALVDGVLVVARYRTFYGVDLSVQPGGN